MPGLDLLAPFLDSIVGTVGGVVRAVGQSTVTLTNAQVLALRAAPITLVAAPGTSKRHQLVAASLKLTATAGAYTETDDNFVIRYVDGSGVIVSETIQTTGFVDQAAVIYTNARPSVDAIATSAQCANQALVLHNSGNGELGGGNAANSLVVVTYFLVVPA